MKNLINASVRNTVSIENDNVINYLDKAEQISLEKIDIEFYKKDTKLFFKELRKYVNDNNIESQEIYEIISNNNKSLNKEIFKDFRVRYAQCVESLKIVFKQ